MSTTSPSNMTNSEFTEEIYDFVQLYLSLNQPERLLSLLYRKLRNTGFDSNKKRSGALNQIKEYLGTLNQQQIEALQDYEPMSDKEEKKFRKQLDNNIGQQLKSSRTSYIPGTSEITEEEDLSDTEESVMTDLTSTAVPSKALPMAPTTTMSKPSLNLPNQDSAAMNQSIWMDESELDQTFSYSFVSVTS